MFSLYNFHSSSFNLSYLQSAKLHTPDHSFLLALLLVPRTALFFLLSFIGAFRGRREVLNYIINLILDVLIHLSYDTRDRVTYGRGR